MTITEKIKGELAMGLRLVAYKPVTVQIPPMAVLDDAMQQNGWSAVSEVVADSSTLSRYYYDTAQKNYVLAAFNTVSGACDINAVEEGDVLEKLSFPELKKLAGLIDKKSVAFIRIYSEKELAAASGDERAALEERRQKMVDEAEVALRKR
ncbi:MAG: hypothetical protein IKI39_07700 [Oscillospiraceae bacterium]|nr:hypothetical protein [Oscillospiraceae bacterium]MBR7074976.1 hypothetical protein [Oscillospiraceae bacterium]